MRSSIRIVSALSALFLGTWGSSWAQIDPIAAGQLEIQGNRLTLYADELTTDADQTINVGERARVRTCFGGSEVPCGSVLPGDLRVSGLVVEAELRGPELPQAVPLQTVPGGTFVLPGFQQEGDYRLENIRLVNASSGQVLGSAEPSLAILHVRRIVLASATVEALSLADLQARGITLTEENFQAFNFAVGFALAGETISIEFPVVYTGNGVLQELSRPQVRLDNLPPDVVDSVRRWQPPHIVPFRLERRTEEDRELLTRGAEGQEALAFPLFGAIVIPGTVTYLNQFFEARLVVANGAPGDSEATLENLHGALRLPGGNVLRIAQSEPPVVPGQEVPIAQANGSRILDPGEQGTAAWTVEGLRPGTHAVTMDITGDLVRPGRDPLPVASVAQAAVEVVDARFNLTFSHPDVVREGEEYTLFVTVSNLSQATQNLITVEIRDDHMTGAHPADTGDTMKRTIETLEPGQSETVEYELVSDLNGKVVATTYQSDSLAGTGTILLRAGVGELGIPLSPATLLLPRFSERLKPPWVSTDELVKSHVRLLGLAYSLAVAPAGMIPPGTPRVIKTDVERRAIDLAEAGQRIFLQEPVLESLEVLALDQLGNRHPLAEFDELRRRTHKGLRAAAQLAVQFREMQEERSLDAVELFDHFAETTSYARPWMAALLVPSGDAPVLELRRPTPQGMGRLAQVSDDEDAALRSLPYGEIFAVKATAFGAGTVPFAVVGHLEPEELFEVVLANATAGAVSGRLLVIVPDGDCDQDCDYRRLDFGTVTVPAGGAVAVEVGAGVPDPGAGGFGLYDPALGTPVGPSPVKSTVPLPPFRLIGAVQDFPMAEAGPDVMGNMIRPNRYGNGLSYLFNRPPDPEAGETPGNYRIRSTFTGLDVVGEPASGVSEKVGTGAWVQTNSERVVNVRYSTPLSALVAGDGRVLLTHEHLLDPAGLLDLRGNPLASAQPPPIIETVPLHVGGLVDGKVVRGTGEVVVGAKVELIRPRYVETMKGTVVKLDYLGETTTDADGRFYFDYLENPNWDKQVGGGFTLRATVPPGDDPELEPAQVEEISSVIRLQNRMAHVNIALLGRGTITGSLVYLDTQEPVPDGKVSAASTLFREIKTVNVEADGSFRFPGMPVGPITLTGRDDDGRRVYATVGIEEPGDTVEVRLELQRIAPPGLGTVLGRVLRRRSGDPPPEPEPAAGALVACYSNGQVIGQYPADEAGRFRFDDVPEGRVSLQAADWRVSRTPAFTDLILGAGETAEVDLTLPEGSTRTVTGTVHFDDPISGSLIPLEGIVAFIAGPGNFAYTGADGRYRIEGVPVQGVTDHQYQLTVIDNERHQQETVALPPILDSSPELIYAQNIVLTGGIWEGGVDGVVLDPLGRPMAGVEVVLFPFAEMTTLADGSFSFDDIPVGDYTLTAHIGDGLQPGYEGYFASARTRIVFAGHRPFSTLRMRGAGIVRIHTHTATSTGLQTPIYYKPTYYSETARSIQVKGSYIERTTGVDGRLELVLPVGSFEVVAYNPFHGIREIAAQIEYPGQIRDLDVLFEDASTVRGQVVDVDGRTPVPDVPVKLHTRTLLPQTQRTDAQGNFQFELVPKGGISVTAAGMVGTVERVGRIDGSVTIAGQTLDLVLEMKAQGSIRGQVMEDWNGELQPLAYAQYYVQEGGYPNRRLPEDGTWLRTDAQGRYELSHLYAGRVTVVARDSGQVSRKGSAGAEITADWQVAQVPDIVMKTSVGSLAVVVRDPETGGPVPDSQVRLSNGEVTVAGPQGDVVFDALPLGTYSVYAFNAPTGQSGRISGLRLTAPGQHLSATVYLDQRGEIHGTLFDDEARYFPVPGGTVRLGGITTSGRMTALATTSGASETLGRFSFLGIPEGTFQLKAAEQGSPRRAYAEVELTETAPTVDINMVLEPVGDVYLRLVEKLTAGLSPIDPASGLYSIRLGQASIDTSGNSYDFTQMEPVPASDVYFFPELLLERSVSINAQELAGEQRRRQVWIYHLETNNPLAGSGTFGDPYQVVLEAKGSAQVWVQDSSGNPIAGANTTLYARGSRFPSVTGADGSVTFYAVPAGNLTATATSPTTGYGGLDRDTLTYDDEVAELIVTLAPAVKAHGIVYQPLPDDRYLGDPSTLVPMVDAIVEIRDAKSELQVAHTGEDGTYHFDVLPTGGYTLKAQNSNGDQLASTGGTLFGPDGYDNELPALVLDAAPPRIVSLVPPPGIEGVSRAAAVEIVFSEPLLAAVLPTGQTSSYYFSLEWAGGPAAGVWTSYLDELGQQVVRFTPTGILENEELYSLTIQGGWTGVRDRIGRPLTEYGNVGSNFKTSDSVGPTVIATVPSLEVPVDPLTSIRFDFNEAIVAGDEALDGDGVGDAAELYGESAEDGWVPLPVVLYLTRSGYSLQVEPLTGVTLRSDTLRRRIVVSPETGRLQDSYGNVMETWEKSYRLFDDHAPMVAAVPFPDGAPAGDLIQGVAYTLVPVLTDVDDVTPENPGGDIDRVEYFFADPEDPTNPQLPSYSALSHPFSYAFIGAYSGDGTQPRPFPVWVKAVDTSTNESNVWPVAMQVLPNAPPVLGALSAEALAPVAGTFYAGSAIRAVISGLDDLDGAQLTLSVELWQTGTSSPLAAEPGRLVLRPATGWADLEPQTFDFEIPIDLAEGTPLFFRARVIDSQQAEATAENDPFLVADDTDAPRVDAVTVRAADGTEQLVYFIGDQLTLEFRARDFETAVASVEVTFDRADIFPSPIGATLIAGSDGRYRTATLTVPPDVFTDAAAIVATAAAADYGGNRGEQSFTFEVAAAPDPTAPSVEWLTPWSGAAWPAGYTSVFTPAAGTPLLLRVAISDVNLDDEGNEVPGTIVAVTFRGPVVNASGEIELAASWTAGEIVAGTEAQGSGIYQLLWWMPNHLAASTELPFAVRAVDSGGRSTVASAGMAVVTARRVYEGVLMAISADDPMLYPEGDPNGPSAENGPVFLVDGTTLSLYPRTDGGVRRLPAMVLYAGGELDVSGELVVEPSVLTAPEVTSYESAILFHPLELAIDEVFAVGHGCRVDLSEQGLLGSTTEDSMVLPGEVGAEPWAGGSHGGRGWFGSPSGGWDREDLNQPGSVYDSLRDPYLPGGGGGSPSSTVAGGAGGGVVRLDAGGATMRLVGDVVAGGGSAYAGGGAGGAIRLVAGRLEGRGRIDAAGGHGTTWYRSGGGGGGRVSIAYRELGPEVDLAAQINVAGGHNHASDPASATRRGGAGTIYLEQLDPVTGASGGVGRLVVANLSGLPAARTPLPALGDGAVLAVDPIAATVTLDVDRVTGDLTGDRLVLEQSTGVPVGGSPVGGQMGGYPITAQERLGPTEGFRIRLTVAATAAEIEAVAALLDAGTPVLFHGRGRLSHVEATGPALFVADDDLELGPADDPAPVLNDRSQLTFDGEARGLLRGDVPVATITATPPESSDVRVGSTIALAWVLNDPVGLIAASEQWSFDADPTLHAFSDEPLEVTSGDEPLLLAIPADAVPGAVSYTLEAADAGGRSTIRVMSWNVLANAPPTGYAAMAGGGPATVKAGYAAAVVVHAEDLEGLAGVTLTASGPVSEASQSQTVATTGTLQDLPFEIEVRPDADGTEPVVLEAVITDISDTSTTTATLVIAVTPNEVPAGSLELAAGASATLQPGESTTLAVHAEDPDGLATITLEAQGAVEPVSQTLAVTGTSEDVAFPLTVLGEALPGPVSVTAVLTDRFGASFVTAALELTVVEDTTLPEAAIELVPEAATFVSGDVVEIIATGTDNVGISTLRITVGEDGAEGSATPLSYLWTVPPVAAVTPMVITVEVTDPAGNPGRATREVTVEPLVNAVAPEIRFDCPTTGAYLPSGWDLTLQAAATDDIGVAYVELYRDDEAEPFVTLRPEVGTEPAFAVSTAVLLPVVTGEETVRVRAVAWDSSLNSAVAEIEVHVVEAVALDADEAANDWPALESQFAMLPSGTLTLEESRTLGGLIVLPGASITHPVSAPGAERAVDLTVDGPVYVACDGAIDVSGRGYGGDSTYPGESPPASTAGGSHLGYGGGIGTLPGSTYGSVVRPQENGGGGQHGSYGQRGGGVIRLTALANVTVDGALRADGLTGSLADSRGGAGGSVWIAAAEISGSGTIAARGGDSGTRHYGSGGGGAIALEYGAGSGTLFDHLRAGGGAVEPVGGAGTVYLYGPSSVYGDLIVDNAPADGGITELPSLGNGIAQTGSAGAVLVTDRSTIPAYFVGHWVEIHDAASGELEGSWRIAGIDGVTVTLEANAGEPVTADPGDLWQGVYRFDDYAVRNVGTVESADPIRLAGVQEITGAVELREIVGHHLILRSGALLSHPPTVSATAPESLRIELTGDLVIEAGAAIDVSHLGYPGSTTYPGETASGDGGGSHLGVGGGRYPGSTYGSVVRPQENGGGGYSSSSALPGGGTVRIIAANVTLVDPTSAIRANGGPGQGNYPRGSAGGSVWITVSGALSGAGTIEARGGAPVTRTYGSGGGGAIALEYGAGSGTLFEHLRAGGGAALPVGGAGTVYLYGPSSVYGDLIVDNDPASGGVTELPSLGSGVAQAGSDGAVLVTDRSAIPAYFVGHWVEIRDAASGELEGSWRIVGIDGVTAGVDGVTVTLEANAGEPVTVDPGDLWQGVYRFDNYAVRNVGSVESADPIRVVGTQEITGSVELREIVGHHLILRSGTTLSHPPTVSSTAPESLRIELTGDLVIEKGAAIDVSHLGYPGSTTYPGETASGDGAGSHLGVGGGRYPGSTYGSVVRPQENGGGGYSSSSALPGGGTVRIIAANVTLVDPTSAIRANGGPGQGNYPRGSAGGSVWITVSGALSGDGTIEARGGAPVTRTYGSGGGGAIALEYGAGSGTVLGNLLAYGGDADPIGGAGTVTLFGPTSTWGDLIVDNGGFPGANTELPALGSGTAQAGTSGARLITDRGIAIPPYFIGHWVEIEAADGTPKGIWRIGTIDGVAAMLVPAGAETISLVEGDLWQGVYRFDDVIVTGGATLVYVDPVHESGMVMLSKAGERLAPNQRAPQLDPAAVTIAVGRVADSYRIDVAAAAVTDVDGIAEVRLADGESWMIERFSPADGASFLWPGVPGRALTLTAIDAHAVLRRGRQIKLPPLPEGDWAVPRLTLPAGELPQHAIAGRDWVAVADRTVRVFASPGGELLAELAPLGPEDRTLGLAAGNGTLIAAHARRLDVVDLKGVEGAFAEIGLDAGETIVDVAADEREAVVLVRSASEDELRLISLPFRGAPAELGFPRRGTNAGLSERSFFAIPDDGRSFELRLLPGSVQVIGSDPAGDEPGVLYVFPNAALGEAIAAEPEAWAIDAGWRIERTWERGLILVDGPVARLLELSGDGQWREASRLVLEREILAAAGDGDRIALVLPGEVLVFDVRDPAAPWAVARIAGSAQRELQWIGELLLWSPGFAATPVVLEVEDWPAGKGGESGFVPVVDGRGEEIW